MFLDRSDNRLKSFPDALCSKFTTVNPSFNLPLNACVMKTRLAKYRQPYALPFRLRMYNPMHISRHLCLCFPGRFNPVQLYRKLIWSEQPRRTQYARHGGARPGVVSSYLKPRQPGQPFGRNLKELLPSLDVPRLLHVANSVRTTCCHGFLPRNRR